MFIKRARCSNCNNSLPVTPGFNPFRFPPYEIECKKCHARIKTSFSHRMTWLSWLVWGWSWFLITLLSILVPILDHRYSLAEAVIIVAVSSLVFGFFGGFIICLIVPLPLQLIIDLSRLILIKAGIVKSQEHKAQEF